MKFMKTIYFRAFCVLMTLVCLAGIAGCATWDTQSSDRPVLDTPFGDFKTSR
jgi:hypothetical protein